MSDAKTPSTPVSALNPEQVCGNASLHVFCLLVSAFVCLLDYFVGLCFCSQLVICYQLLMIFCNFTCLYVNPNCNADGQDGEKAGSDTWWSPHGHCPHPSSQAWAQVCFQLNSTLKFELLNCTSMVEKSPQFYRSVSQPCSPAAPLGERLSAAEARRAAIDGLKVDLLSTYPLSCQP